jgi:transglutaminase-like putative cysteine protease
MNDRTMTLSRAGWVLLATAIPGLLFAPVFGLTALAPPVAAVVVACFAVVALAERFAALRPWRPVLALVVGLLALVEVSLFHTTRGGLPTVDSVRALVAGVTDSWQLTLQSTWPVRPEAELLLFVPLLVLLTAMVGIELLRWPAVAALPSLLLLLVSQAFVAVSGIVATLVALGYAIVVAGLYFSRARSAIVLTVALSVAAGFAATVVDPGPAYSVRQNQSAQVPLPRTVSPLSEVAARLSDPDREVFSYTSDAPVDRWRLVVLDDFNGVTWLPSNSYRRLGAGIGPEGDLTVPTRSYTARLTVPGDEEWVPSQAMPESVTGIAPYVDQATGTLLLPDRTGQVTYDLRWWELDGDLSGLLDAAVSSDVRPGGVGAVPEGVAELARTATGDARPTFKTALVLEQYLSREYKVETGTTGLPTGSGWPQLREFLLDTRRGTSEQFAASYVVLARMVGIPARLAVGYRAPREPEDGKMVVHNGDVLVWPEVAVTGVGWVPLDPAGAASGAGPAPASRLAEVTEKARAALPPPDQPVPDPPVAPVAQQDDPGPTIHWWWVLWGVAGLLALLVLLVLAVPVVKLGRTLRRKRFTGVRGVVGAWSEARDVIRSYGTRVTPGMTARDLAAVSDGSIVDSLHRLAVQLDTALWSGSGANDSTVAAAWTAVREIRGALAKRSFAARLRAVFAFR